MKTRAGLWIDHRKAVIVIMTGKIEETLEVPSHVERQPGRFDGIRSTTPFEAQHVHADDRQERAFTDHLNQYYDRVIEAIRDAGSLLVFGPGEAKGQLLKRLEHASFTGHLLEMETADEMTDRQISAKVREHFLKPVSDRQSNRATS